MYQSPGFQAPDRGASPRVLLACFGVQWIKGIRECYVPIRGCYLRPYIKGNLGGLHNPLFFNPCYLLLLVVGSFDWGGGSHNFP